MVRKPKAKPPTDEELASIKVPSGPKTFKLDHPVDRHVPRGAELPKGKTAKATEITMAAITWGDVLEMPLELNKTDIGDMIKVAAAASKEHERTFGGLKMPDLGKITGHVSDCMVAVVSELMGVDEQEDPSAHDGTKPITIKVKTLRLKHHGEALEEITVPVMLADHVLGYPLDTSDLIFEDCRDMIGLATGITDKVLGALELEDVGKLVGVLMGFLVLLRGT